MKHRFTNKLTSETGFSLVEIMIALVITAVIGVSAAMAIGSTFRENSRATEKMKTIEQVENAAYWINRDALMAQVVTPGTNPNFVILTRQGRDGLQYQATYSITGNVLQRSYAVSGVNMNGIPVNINQTNQVAQNINPDPAKTYCSHSNGVLTFNLTSTIGTSSETKSYQVKARIDQPS